MSKLITLDYQGLAVTASREAWFNATQIAEMHGKRLDKFFERKRNQDYVHAIAKKHGLNTPFSGELKTPFSIADYPDLIQAKRGRHNGGTWLHPDLMICFARFISIDFEIWCDQTIKDLLIDGKAWQPSRAESKIGYKVMTEVIQATRQANGQEIERRHFINEALLCNAAITGQFKGLERDSLSTAILNMLTRVEAHNAALIAQGLLYPDRTARLFEMAAPIRTGFQTALNGGAA